MRPVPKAFALAAILTLVMLRGHAAGAQASPATSESPANSPAAALAAGAVLSASEQAAPSPSSSYDAPGSAEASDPDAPPPFMRKPKVPPRATGPDMTYATRPAPMQFRGLPWGAALAEATTHLGLKPVTSPRSLPDTYYRPDENLKLGSAELVTVAYYFHKGAFSGAGIVLAGEANYFLVKDHLIELYGPGRQVGDRYGWTWTHVNIDMRLREGMGEVRYTYEP